jgi:Zn-dependent protease with chaperone function
VTKARVVFALQLALGALAAGALAFAVGVGLGRLSWQMPSATALLQACRELVLPDLTVGSVATLALALLGAGVAWATGRSVVRRTRASRAVLHGLARTGSWDVGGTPVTVFRHPEALAFCAGLLRPRIYVSSRALAVLNPDELEAVVAHERHHKRHRDPLRIFLAGVLSDGLFFVPALRRLAQRHAALAELAADRSAVRSGGGDPAPLASALLAFERADPAVVGIAPERVDGLLGERSPWNLPVALLAWALVVIVAIAALALKLDAAASLDVSLPLLVAQSCMALMALVPGFLVAASLVGARRLVRLR